MEDKRASKNAPCWFSAGREEDQKECFDMAERGGKGETRS